MLLPLISAGLGGYEAYRRSGGNLGATLLGAGAGALVPKGLRMAGTALAGTPVGAAGLSALNQVLGKAGVEATAKGIGNLAALGGTTLLNVPGLAGQVAAGLAPAAKTTANLGAGLIGGGGTVAPPNYGGAALPPGLGGSGPIDPYGTPFDIYSPTGTAAGRRAEYDQIINQQLNAMRTLYPELYRVSEASKKNELQRQMAAAGIRQNITTQANMLERSQQAAQQMGLNIAQQMGNAITSQYQYS